MTRGRACQYSVVLMFSRRGSRQDGNELLTFFAINHVTFQSICRFKSCLEVQWCTFVCEDFVAIVTEVANVRLIVNYLTLYVDAAADVCVCVCV